MLELSSPEWARLSHAYGSASDIPDLLRKLSTAPIKSHDYRAEPWFSLWSALCHQDDVYSASYAAVPHVVANAALRPSDERWDFVLLVTCIEICRHHSDAPPIPAGLEQGYFTALEQMRMLICECLKIKMEDEDDAKVFLSGWTVLNGHPKLSRAILDLPEENICPNCGADVPPKGYELF